MRWEIAIFPPCFKIGCALLSGRSITRDRSVTNNHRDFACVGDVASRDVIIRALDTDTRCKVFAKEILILRYVTVKRHDVLQKEPRSFASGLPNIYIWRSENGKLKFKQRLRSWIVDDVHPPVSGNFAFIDGWRISRKLGDWSARVATDDGNYEHGKAARANSSWIDSFASSCARNNSRKFAALGNNRLSWKMDRNETWLILLRNVRLDKSPRPRVEKKGTTRRQREEKDVKFLKKNEENSYVIKIDEDTSRTLNHQRNIHSICNIHKIHTIDHFLSFQWKCNIFRNSCANKIDRSLFTMFLSFQ